MTPATAAQQQRNCDCKHVNHLDLGSGRPPNVHRNTERVSNGFLQSEVLGRSFRFGGGQFGAKFFAKFAAKFSMKFSALFCWDIQSKKNFSKNFSPKFPWPCTAKLKKFQGKNFMTRFCRGALAKERVNMTQE